MYKLFIKNIIQFPLHSILFIVFCIIFSFCCYVISVRNALNKTVFLKLLKIFLNFIVKCLNQIKKWNVA